MKKKSIILTVLFLNLGLGLFWGCKKATPTDPNSASSTSPTNQATPTSTPVLGSFIVQVNDYNGGVKGVTVYAVPPSGGATYTTTTQTGGFGYVSPPYIEVGNWNLEVPAQKYFGDSKISAPVSAAFQTVTFTSAGSATIYLTPTTNPEQFSNTGGGAFTYNMVYQQPGNLLVPVKPTFSGLPNNWTGTGPTTVGLAQNEQDSITIIGSVCVDQAPSFAVTGVDFEPTPHVPLGANSGPQTISKNFTTSVSVQWYSPNFSNVSTCNLGKRSNSGQLTVSISNGCGTVDVWVQEPSTNCTSGYWNTPNGNTNATGGHITFGAGTYSCTYYSDGGFPTIYARCNTNGATGGSGVGNGTFTILNTSY